MRDACCAMLQGTGTADEVAMDDRRTIASEGIVIAAVEVFRPGKPPEDGSQAPLKDTSNQASPSEQESSDDSDNGASGVMSCCCASTAYPGACPAEMVQAPILPAHLDLRWPVQVANSSELALLHCTHAFMSAALPCCKCVAKCHAGLLQVASSGH